MSKNLLHNKIRRPILVDVQRRNRQGRFIRLEYQLAVLASSDVESDAEYLPAHELTSIQQNRSVSPSVIVKIGCNESLPQGTGQEAVSFPGLRQCSAQPVLRPDQGGSECECNQSKAKRWGTKRHVTLSSIVIPQLRLQAHAF